MAKSDTVHKCEVMDFFAWKWEKCTNIKNTHINAETCMLTSKVGGDISLHFYFPDVIIYVIIYDYYKSVRRCFPQSQTAAVTDC